MGLHLIPYPDTAAHSSTSQTCKTTFPTHRSRYLALTLAPFTSLKIQLRLELESPVHPEHLLQVHQSRSDPLPPVQLL